MKQNPNMKLTKLLMGMPITIEIQEESVDKKIFDKVFDYFKWVDKTFSPYKDSSEVSKLNNNPGFKISSHMEEILNLSNITFNQTNGYFRVHINGKFDPSGIVKGWSIQNAAKILLNKGYKNFYVDAGGDIQTSGFNHSGSKWKVGIRNPFDTKTIVKIVHLHDSAVATSGNYFRGEHIFNPYSRKNDNNNLVSLTVVGPNIFDADRFATAAYAMGKESLNFIDRISDYEAFAIFEDRKVLYTNGFKKYTTS